MTKGVIGNLEASYYAAFLAGLFGGVHCAGMCGGVVVTLNINTPGAVPGGRFWSRALGYNLGRLASYTLAGALLGGVGFIALDIADLQSIKSVLQILVGLLVIAMGLYLAGLWPGFSRLESLGTPWWRLLQPLAQRLLPARSWPQSVALGVVWGWLPCGLTYTMLTWSLASSLPVDGALLMFWFGVGTLPNLLLLGAVADRASSLLHRITLRRLAGVVVMVLGVWQVARSWMM